MYEFFHDYVKPKYSEKAKLCYMDTDSSLFTLFTFHWLQDIAEDAKTRRYFKL